MKELIKDTVYENALTIRLDQSRELLQNMVDLWNALNFAPCTSASQLYDLAYNANQMIQEGKATKEADGDNLPPMEKEAYLNKLKYKQDFHYKAAAAKVTQDAYSERGQNLWIIKDGLVVISKKEATKILKQKSVIAVNDRQVEMGEKIMQIRDSINEINEQTAGHMNISVNDLFAKSFRANGSEDPVTLNLEIFRRLLSFV